MRPSFLVVGGFAVLVSRREGAGCEPPPPTDGRIGLFGHAHRSGWGVVVDGVGVGTPADGLVEPGELVVVADGVPLGGPSGFERLVQLARGVPGTPIELLVQGAAGTRKVAVERRAIGCVARRVERLPTAEELRGLIEASGAAACPPSNSTRVQGTVRRGRVTVLWNDDPSETCREERLEAWETPYDLDGAFAWSALTDEVRVIEPGGLGEQVTEGPCAW